MPDTTDFGVREDGIFDAVVVGAGFGGLYAAYRLSRDGLRIRGFEAGSGVGGTWFWNRYPGARCDVESLDYSFSFSPELQQEWHWSHKYAEQPEILAYLNHVADRFDLRRHFRFETRVVAQIYDEASNLWTVETADGAKLRTRFCVMASGNLSTPRVPDFPGIERFRGRWYHSSRWPTEGVDFSGQRVALVGTGATGVQMVPKIAAQASHLYVFQRTANYSVPARNAPLDPEVEQAHKQQYPELRRVARETGFCVAKAPLPTRSALSLPPSELQSTYQRMWDSGGSLAFLTCFTDIFTDLEANDTAGSFVRDKIRKTVKDRATAELLCPDDHPIGTKRLCVDTDYYESFNRPNVSLVDIRSAPIQEITERGIRTAAAEYEVDAIAFATGFDAMTGALREIDIRGRGGLRLREKWADGPTTYLGLMVAGFPNLFIVTGPGSPSVKSNMVCAVEQHADWIADCLAELDRSGYGIIEPDPAAERDWVAHVNEVADKTLYPRANSWYSGANIPGKPRVFMPYVGGVSAYIQICDAIVADGYRGFIRSVADTPALT